jgi:hypothetical protein
MLEDLYEIYKKEEPRKAFPKLKLWESNLKFRGKSGPPAAFSKSLSQNRALSAHSKIVLGQAHLA